MNIVYLDPVFPEMKKLLAETKPQQADLKFAAEYEGEGLDSILAEADYLVVATEKVDRALIQKLQRVKHIQKTGIGIDNIDLQEAEKKGITVSNTPGANAAGFAELTILLILALYRKLIVLDKATKNGALARALSAGKIAGAGIDVWEGEPPSPNHPLFQFDQVIATPHIGAGTRDTLVRVLRMAFANISLIEKGERPKFLASI